MAAQKMVSVFLSAQILYVSSHFAKPAWVLVLVQVHAYPS